MNAELLNRLTEHTLSVDRTGDWPEAQFDWLAEAGVLGWVIPHIHGGGEASQRELVQGYEALSEACLSTAFILTQRNGACQRIAGCENDELKSELLPQLACGELFATVGISHLTTSRQHIKTPAVAAEIREREIHLSGSIPWVTGAAHAQYIVTGGTCPDGRQVLLALPTETKGVSVQPYAELMALTASHTASVHLDNVIIPAKCLLAGPTEEVMKQGRGGGTGSQVTSTLALGLSQRALSLIQNQARLRDDLYDISEKFTSELEQLRVELYRSLTNDEQSELEASASPLLTAADIRQRANSLVLRITQAAMTVSKGAGFVRGHAAELAVREAMFFLVWSCPQPVVRGVLEELACRD